MILVDIYVPSVDKTYDFHLDERARVRTILEEIVEMIGQMERTSLSGDPEKLLLCDRLGKAPLPTEATLADCGIRSGGSLLLV